MFASLREARLTRYPLCPSDDKSFIPLYKLKLIDRIGAVPNVRDQSLHHVFFKIIQ